jgi:hypothetical protein
MKDPIQIWAPFFEISPLDADYNLSLVSARQNWEGENRIWLLPHGDKVWKWCDNGLFECLIPARIYNVIAIFYVTANAHNETKSIYPPLPGVWPGAEPYPWISQPLIWHKSLPSGLYRQWLNVTPGLRDGARSVYISVPKVVDGRLGWTHAWIELPPAGVVPNARPEDSRDTIGEILVGASKHRLVWPQGQEQARCLHVSPEMECKPLRESEVPQGSILNAAQSYPEFAWPRPFDMLWPGGGGIDLLHHQDMLRQCIADLENGQREQVLRVAQNWVGQLTCEVDAPWYQAWFRPRWAEKGDKVLWDINEWPDYGKEAMQKFLASEVFRNLTQKTIRVQRVQGWLGYFWWEFYQDLLVYTPVSTCEDCGWVIRGGHKDRKRCTKQENPDCFSQQAAKRQRAHRAKRR